MATPQQPRIDFERLDAYRARLYRLIFALAALYNIAFGLWASLWPGAFFHWLEMVPPNYPGLWRCLGMVVGLYGLLYAQAALRLEEARLAIAVGLAGKILGPIGWVLTVRSGEWPMRTFILIAFNDLIWWLPFALFLLEGKKAGDLLRRAAPWACCLLNAAAALVLVLLLRGGMESTGTLAERARYIEEQTGAWRVGWGLWMAAAVSLLAFYAWWGARLPRFTAALGALAIAAAGLACDFFAEALYIGWWPESAARLERLATLLSGGAANGCYTLAGMILTIATPWMSRPLKAWAWATWVFGALLTIFAVAGNVPGMVASTALLMPSLCGWVAVFGRAAAQRGAGIKE